MTSGVLSAPFPVLRFLVRDEIGSSFDPKTPPVPVEVFFRRSDRDDFDESLPNNPAKEARP